MIGSDKEKLTFSEKCLLDYISLVLSRKMIDRKRTSDVYEEYINYCENKARVEPVTMYKFIRWVNHELKCSSESRKLDDGHSHKVFIV